MTSHLKIIHNENDIWRWYFAEETQSLRLWRSSIRLEEYGGCCFYPGAALCLLSFFILNLTVFGIGCGVISLGVVLRTIGRVYFIEAGVMKHYELGALPKGVVIAQADVPLKQTLRATIDKNASTMFRERFFVARDLKHLRRLIYVGNRIDLWMPLAPVSIGITLRCIHMNPLYTFATISVINIIYLVAIIATTVAAFTMSRLVTTRIEKAQVELDAHGLSSDPRHYADQISIRTEQGSDSRGQIGDIDVG